MSGVRSPTVTNAIAYSFVFTVGPEVARVNGEPDACENPLASSVDPDTATTIHCHSTLPVQDTVSVSDPPVATYQNICVQDTSEPIETPPTLMRLVIGPTRELESVG